MQIVCPNCATPYEVPDSVFGGRGRKLRCEHCGHGWRAGPPAGDAASPAPTPAPRELSEPYEPSSEPHEPLPHADAEPPHAAQMPAPSVPSPAPTVEGGDRFADFIHLVRSNAVELEPEPPPRPLLRVTSPTFFAVLVVLFVAAFAVLEHRTLFY